MQDSVTIPVDIEMSVTFHSEDSDSEDSACGLNAEEHTADAMYADQCAVTEEILNYDSSIPRQVFVPNTPEDRQGRKKKKSPQAPIAPRYRKVRAHTPIGQRVAQLRQARLEKELAKSEVIRRFEKSHAEILRKLEECDVGKLKHKVEKLQTSKLILKSENKRLEKRVAFLTATHLAAEDIFHQYGSTLGNLAKHLCKYEAPPGVRNPAPFRTFAVKSAPRKGHPGKSQDY